jgi:hypothetical protein
MNPEVTTYIQNVKQAWQADICTQLRQVVQTAIPDVVERIQYGKPHFLKNGKYACVLGTAKDWVSFTIFNAEGLEEPAGLFEAGGSPERKTVKVRQGQALDTDLLTKLVQQAAGSL